MVILSSLISVQVADLLFFVIDNQTRATASRVEVAYLVGKSSSTSPAT